MSLFSKNIEPLLVSNVNRIKLKETTLPQLSDLNLTQVLNSEVTCRVCRGNRVVYVRSRADSRLNISNCMNCKGTGKMRNGDGGAFEPKG